mmetsp:Transcript_144500/g.402589  ORF Transcript_144500/g.402589 Transcript_144500/m.402589 type:complete len:236 (-) Transcript_144500:10-717(-)
MLELRVARCPGPSQLGLLCPATSWLPERPCCKTPPTMHAVQWSLGSVTRTMAPPCLVPCCGTNPWGTLRCHLWCFCASSRPRVPSHAWASPHGHLCRPWKYHPREPAGLGSPRCRASGRWPYSYLASNRLLRRGHPPSAPAAWPNLHIWFPVSGNGHTMEHRTGPAEPSQLLFPSNWQGTGSQLDSCNSRHNSAPQPVPEAVPRPAHHSRGLRQQRLAAWTSSPLPCGCRALWAC